MKISIDGSKSFESNEDRSVDLSVVSDGIDPLFLGMDRSLQIIHQKRKQVEMGMRALKRIEYKKESNRTIFDDEYQANGWNYIAENIINQNY